jgi:hypothetical protein
VSRFFHYLKCTITPEIRRTFFKYPKHPAPKRTNHLVEESDDLSGDVLATGLLVVHDSSGGGKDDVSELTGRKELGDPLLELVKLDVVAGRDTSGLVDASVELDNDLSGTVVVNLLELSNVSWGNVSVVPFGSDFNWSRKGEIEIGKTTRMFNVPDT